MKCSNCGSENLKVVDLEKMFHIYGDASCTSFVDTYICLECGHLEFFNLDYVGEYKKKMLDKKEIERTVDSYYAKIKELENQKFDPLPYKKEIEKLQEELKTLNSLNVDGKAVRAREDAIKENKKILDEKQDPNVLRQINQLKYEISELEKKYPKID